MTRSPPLSPSSGSVFCVSISRCLGMLEWRLARQVGMVGFFTWAIPVGRGEQRYPMLSRCAMDGAL